MRARFEHIFGAQSAKDGHRIRTVGIDRTEVKMGLLNLT